MRTLFIARDLPYPADNGYRKRNFYFLKALSERGVGITLLCEDAAPDKKNALDYLKTLCEEVIIIEPKKQNKLSALLFSLFSSLPFSVALRNSKMAKKQVNKCLRDKNFDAVICDAIFRSMNVPLQYRGFKMLYEHNIESIIVKRYAQQEKNILKKLLALLESKKLEKFETKTWNRFNCTATCSATDKEIIENRARDAKVYIIPNGVDSGYFSPDSYGLQRNSIVYTGQIGWHPNEDALLYFVRTIYPIIKKEEPTTSLWIVGNNPTSKIRMLARNDSSIIITGYVDDVRPYIGEAHVYVVPLRIGSGTRLKILEALSMKKAIVSTSVGCEGIEVENNKHLLIRDGSVDFANAVLEIMKNDELRIRLGKNGHRLIEEKYEWNTVFGNLDEMIETMKTTTKTNG
ncbi:MAG: glycosyltransferase [Candidatus Omnitrophota bacterium]|jgi:sugar transferase (PEP-CTERM/EpsH1 system associated)|nr:MAG: glycosyltransferase [Candidatus Omnitrophota bacterium]